MQRKLSLSMRKLTKRVTDIGQPPSISIANMAEQEEDYSSLPLPERFQHKVPRPAFDVSWLGQVN